MHKHFFGLAVLAALFFTPQNALAAPKKYLWGAAPSTDVMTYFHRQSNNISNFHFVLPIHCEYVDGTSGNYSLEISGDEVPNLLVNRRGKVEAEFQFSDPFFLNPIDVYVTMHFSGSRAVVAVVAAETDSEEECSGGAVLDRVRKGARVR